MSQFNQSEGLYRIPEQGRIAGVCAGLGDRFGIEVWLIRIGMVSASFLGMPFMPLLYIVAWLMLDKKPALQPQQPPEFADTVYVKSRVWQQGQPPQVALQQLDQQFSKIEQRVQQLETYVTSPEFNLSNEINKL